MKNAFENSFRIQRGKIQSRFLKNSKNRKLKSLNICLMLNSAYFCGVMPGALFFKKENCLCNYKQSKY